MVSLSFLLVILPLFVAVFLVAPVRARPAVLLVCSLGYCLLVQPAFLPLMLLLVALDWAALLVMDRFDGRENLRRACVWFSVVKNLLMIFYASAVLQMRGGETVLGLMIYCLSGMSCVIEVFKREIPAERNPVNFFLYCCFFPKLYAGPLMPYARFRPQLQEMRLSAMDMLRGFGLYIQGAVKVQLLGLPMQGLYDALRLYAGDDRSVLSHWLMLLTLALSVYFRLSGLCDMARGLGRVFSLNLPNNFYYPYQSHSVADFFDRFNITVSSFIRRTVYAGLQEDRNGPLADSLNMLVVCMLMGLWFGFRINLLAWGVYLAAFMIAERYLYPAAMQAVPQFFRRIYALCVILSSFTLFAGETLAESASLIAGMFAFGSLPLVTDRLQYLVATNWLLLVAALLFATSLVHMLLSLLRRHLPRITAALMAAVNAGLLALLVSMMMD